MFLCFTAFGGVKKVNAHHSDCGMPWDISLLSNLSELILLLKGHWWRVSVCSD